ncbi:hypothetical protein CRM22_007780 [Opisthorchis felineus]|uniref:START domain-containing protein n=1 Tax=Opisthorchis felineus TaxID=147828 RepID=A0A4S2LGC7_OPIFE|nr:hypothetical protein CRM22_007780 [Opisthorchis felineus]
MNVLAFVFIVLMFASAISQEMTTVKIFIVDDNPPEQFFVEQRKGNLPTFMKQFCCDKLSSWDRPYVCRLLNYDHSGEDHVLTCLVQFGLLKNAQEPEARFYYLGIRDRLQASSRGPKYWVFDTRAQRIVKMHLAAPDVTREFPSRNTYLKAQLKRDQKLIKSVISRKFVLEGSWFSVFRVYERRYLSSVTIQIRSANILKTYHMNVMWQPVVELLNMLHAALPGRIANMYRAHYPAPRVHNSRILTLQASVISPLESSDYCAHIISITQVDQLFDWTLCAPVIESKLVYSDYYTMRFRLVIGLNHPLPVLPTIIHRELYLNERFGATFMRCVQTMKIIYEFPHYETMYLRNNLDVA